MKYLTVEEILQIHDKLIEQFGGERGAGIQSNLDFIVDKIQSSKTDIYHKAAMLLHDIITNHPFTDGNKRTALEASKTFLRVNGKLLKIKDINQAGEYINSIAEGKRNIFSVENWIKTHCD